MYECNLYVVKKRRSNQNQFITSDLLILFILYVTMLNLSKYYYS